MRTVTFVKNHYMKNSSLIISLTILILCGCSNSDKKDQKKKEIISLASVNSNNNISDTSVTVSKKIKNDLEERNLKGNVKIVIERAYEVFEKFGESEYKLQGTYEYHFDKNGNLTLIDENYTQVFNREAVKYETFTYKYDKNGNILEKNEYNSNGYLNTKIKNKYDEIGNMIQSSFYNSNGELEQTYTFQYDKKGNEIRNILSIKNLSPNLVNKCKYKYDKKGNILEKEAYNEFRTVSYSTGEDGIGSNTTITIYKYDKNGNMIEKKEDGETFIYNKNGDIDYRKPNSPLYTIEAQNNAYNTSIDESGSKDKYEYKYDSKGNWINKKMNNNRMIERKITYY